jgi:hypothetical protein
VGRTWLKAGKELRWVIPQWDEQGIRHMRSGRARFLKLGLADSTLPGLARQAGLALTDDFPRYGSLAAEGLPATSFPHLRREA